jgi:hypothetical protein
MKPLYERLKDTGVDIDQHVIFLIEEKGETKSWRATDVSLATVLTELPPVDEAETESDYNPANHLLLAVETQDAHQRPELSEVIMVGLQAPGAALFEVPGQGFVYEGRNTRYTIGQHRELFARFRTLTGSPTLQ